MITYSHTINTSITMCIVGMSDDGLHSSDLLMGWRNDQVVFSSYSIYLEMEKIAPYNI